MRGHTKNIVRLSPLSLSRTHSTHHKLTSNLLSSLAVRHLGPSSKKIKRGKKWILFFQLVSPHTAPNLTPYFCRVSCVSTSCLRVAPLFRILKKLGSQQVDVPDQPDAVVLDVHTNIHAFCVGFFFVNRLFPSSLRSHWKLERCSCCSGLF